MNAATQDRPNDAVKASACRRQRLDRVRADIKALAERLEAAIARQGS